MSRVYCSTIIQECLTRWRTNATDLHQQRTNQIKKLKVSVLRKRFLAWQSIVSTCKIKQRIMIWTHRIASMQQCFSALRDRADCILAGRRFVERYHKWRAEIPVTKPACSISGSNANSPVESGQTVSSLHDGVLSLQSNSLRVVNVGSEPLISVSVFKSSNSLFVVNVNADVVSCLQVSVLVRKSSEQISDINSNKMDMSKMLKSTQYITIDPIEEISQLLGWGSGFGFKPGWRYHKLGFGFMPEWEAGFVFKPRWYGKKKKAKFGFKPGLCHGG